MENKSRIDKIKLAYEYKSIILSQGSNYIFKRLFVPFKDWCGSLYDNRFHILKMGIIMIMAYQFIDWSDLFESYQEYIHLGLGYVGILAILFAPLLSLARKIYRTIKWVVRKTRRK